VSETSDQDAAFQRAVTTVMRDVDGTCPGLVSLSWGQRDEWLEPGESRMVAWFLEPSGTGVGLRWPRLGGVEAIAQLANDASEAVVEALWSAHRPTNWPRCPRHPTTHPLEARVDGGLAVWTCPKSGHRVATVGSLVELANRRR
jgi:hypothetical protein